MATGSGWGYGKWGDTLIWGYQVAGVLSKGAVISDSIVALLAQTTPAVLAYSATIELDGVDITAHCGPFTITHRGRGGVSSCEFQLLDNDHAPTLYQSVISVTVGIQDSAGVTYSQERFRGKCQNIEIEKTASVVTSRITAFDLGYGLTQLSSSQTVRALYADGISALDMIEGELAIAGFGPPSGSFIDYTPGVWLGSMYGSVRDSIYALSQGNRDTVVYVDPAGNLILTDYADSEVSPFLFPLTAQTDQQHVSLVAGYCNKLLAQWRIWSATAGMGVTGDVTVDDLANQALKGVIWKTPNRTLVVASINSADTTAVKTAAAQAAGAAFIAASQKQQYGWGSPLNPFLFPGNVVTLALAAGGTDTVRVDTITETGGPDGYWALWEGRSVA